MKKRVVSILCLLIILSSIFIGCYNYTEINEVTFATSIIFDRDEYDNVVLYLDCVRPYRNANESSDKGQRVLFQGKGKTALEAIRDIDISSSNKLNFTQVRAYIFTEQVARKGINKYIDLINNDQQLSFKPYMFVYFGEVSSLLELTSGEEEYLGLYLNQLINKNKDNGKVIYSNINDYISDSLISNNLSYMSAIRIKETPVSRNVELDGGVIMRDNHLVDILEENDVLSYNLLNNVVRKGTFEISNPEEIDKFITLDILEHYIDTKVVANNDGYDLDKNIQIKVSIGEIQGKLRVTQEILKTIEVAEENKLNNYLQDFYKKYQSKGIDVLGVNRLIQEKYPNNTIDDPFGKTKLNLNIDLIIDGSSLVKDSI